MDILGFVDESQIDPLYFDSSYFVVPEEEGRKAYELLLRALEASNRVGIAKLAMFQREYVVFIRPYDRGLALHTMHFANEIREAPGYGKTEDVKLKPQEIKLAEQLVDSLSEDFHVEQYHDEFEDRLKALIEAKRKGKAIAAAPERRRAPVIDITTALKKSLAATSAHKARPVHGRPRRVEPISLPRHRTATRAAS